MATTETKSGNTGFWIAGGGVQLGLVGVVGGLAGGLAGGGEVFVSGKAQLKEQPAPRVRDMIRMRRIAGYFMFTLFIDVLL